MSPASEQLGCASAPLVGDCFQQPELFLSTITINKARERIFIFHSKYFLHPVSSQFTRWTGEHSSKEAHKAISSSSSSPVQSPAPAPTPALAPRSQPDATLTIPSNSLQSKEQVLLGGGK